MSDKHILIVENNPDDAFLIQRAFKTLPLCTSFLCRSASEAQAYLERAGIYSDVQSYPDPDAILTEIRLGGESAFDLLDWIRRRDATSDLTIYIFAGAISPKDERTLRPFRVKAIFEKPVGLEEMEKCLKAIAEGICGS